MNRKAISHGLKITAIIIAAFVAASLTPAKSYAKTTEASAITIVNENEAPDLGAKMIADNDVPLAAAPSATDNYMKIGWIIISISAVMTGIVIFEDLKERYSN